MTAAAFKTGKSWATPSERADGLNTGLGDISTATAGSLDYQPRQRSVGGSGFPSFSTTAMPGSSAVTKSATSTSR